MTEQDKILEAKAEAYNDAMLIVLAEAAAWVELSNEAPTEQIRSEMRYIAGALRKAADRIRRRANEITG